MTVDHANTYTIDRFTIVCVAVNDCRLCHPAVSCLEYVIFFSEYFSDCNGIFQLINHTFCKLQSNIKKRIVYGENKAKSAPVELVGIFLIKIKLWFTL